jgi:hypothetical protein
MKRSLIFIAVFIRINIAIFPQEFTNFEAKQILREWGVYSGKIIQVSETTTISGGSITGWILAKSVDNAVNIWKNK